MIRTALIAPRTFTAPLIRALGWLADRDAAYRERRKLEELPPERLADMGLERGPEYWPEHLPERSAAGPRVAAESRLTRRARVRQDCC